MGICVKLRIPLKYRFLRRYSAVITAAACWAKLCQNGFSGQAPIRLLIAKVVSPSDALLMSAKWAEKSEFINTLWGQIEVCWGPPPLARIGIGCSWHALTLTWSSVVWDENNGITPKGEGSPHAQKMYLAHSACVRWRGLLIGARVPMSAKHHASWGTTIV